MPVRSPGDRDVVYVPTPMPVVDEMLAVAKIHPGDVVYDLGSGDGRVLIAAAKKFGVKAVGIEIDPDLVREARENVWREGVEALVNVVRADIFKTDLTPASVVTMYLLTRLNAMLVPQLEKLAPGTRIVSHDFDIEGAIPDGRWTVRARSLGPLRRRVPRKLALRCPEQVGHEVYLWVAPLKWARGRHL